MKTNHNHRTLLPKRRKTFLKILVPSCILCLLFLISPYWLNAKISGEFVKGVEANPELSSQEKSQYAAVFRSMDLQKVFQDKPPEWEDLRLRLEAEGLRARFDRLILSRNASLVLVGLLGCFAVGMLGLSRRAETGRDALVRCYRLGWRMTIAMALVQLLLFVPLACYGLFECTVLAMNRYFPQLMLLIAFGGVYAIWRCMRILLRKAPLEFDEPFAQQVTPQEAPRLWHAVREAAARLGTEPPDIILLGMQLKSYVTELAVRTTGGVHSGRTLYLSCPLLKHLTPAEALAVIGHELGHFVGDDTVVSRQFYPMKWKANKTTAVMLEAGWVAWSSTLILEFFHCCFVPAEQKRARERELLADQKSAALTSAGTAARALLKIEVFGEAFALGMQYAPEHAPVSPMDLPMQAILCELTRKEEFWSELIEKSSTHPLDSHPDLRTRLEALGKPMRIDEAQASVLALDEDSAYASWIPSDSNLLQSLIEEMDQVVQNSHEQTALVQADPETEEGRALLNVHFPEVRWKAKPTTTMPFWLAAVFFVPAILLAQGIVSLPKTMGPGANIGVAGIIGSVGGIFILSGLVHRKRHHRAEFVLNVRGVTYSGWKTPLLFRDIKGCGFPKIFGQLNWYVQFKKPQASLWKFSLVPFPVGSLQFNVSLLQGDPNAICQTIGKYVSRSLE